MRWFRILIASVFLVSFLFHPAIGAEKAVVPAPPAVPAGYRTNPPIVYRALTLSTTNLNRNPRFGQTNDFEAISKRLPPEAFERTKKMRLSQPEFLTNVYTFTNPVFAHFVAGSMNEMIWTNLVAATNGRNNVLWSRRQHPLLWPLAAPQVEWNKRGILWGMQGLTALSPCWEKEGAAGQIPVTLITPRHGYTRGHGMGPEGIVNTFRNRKVWFVSADDKVIEARVTSAAVRSQHGRDYTILMFASDLPDTIKPMRVADIADFNLHCPMPHGTPALILRTEQEGHVSVELPGFTHPHTKGGDSGSPNLFPLLGELVFLGGRTTSSPSKEMQEDIDALCARESADPRKYQLGWVNFEGWPAYKPGSWQ